MRITANSLKIIANDLDSKLVRNHMSNITIINSHDLFVTFSMFRKEKLLISLNPQNPFVSLAVIDNPTGTKVGNFSDVLRKEVKEGSISKISTLNDDRVLIIDYLFTNDYFEREEKKLVIELIPHRPNLLILNNENTIIYAYHQSDLSSPRPILKGLKYPELVNNNSLVKDEGFSLEKMREFATKYYSEAKRKRLEEQYKPVIQHIKSRIKTLKHKIEVLNKEIEAATENLSTQDIGQMILTYAQDEQELKQYIQENSIAYDFSLTPGLNASKYFAKYKKAKRTLEVDKIEIVKTNDEIDYLETCLAQTKFMEEDDIIELGALLFPNKFKIGSKKNIKSAPGVLTVNGNKILFGKNSKQNDTLTFKMANKNDQFFHIKDNHGSHVIIQNEKPDNDTILTACEVALLLSGKECGDVQNTLVKNVKKGSHPGQALLSSYQTYTIKQIRQKTKDLLGL